MRRCTCMVGGAERSETDCRRQPEGRGRPAESIQNPKFDYLCSVGLVFKLCHALLKMRPLDGFNLREHLDLVALGTVADIVPLVDENRVLVQRGMQQLARSRWPGGARSGLVAGRRGGGRS